jgi:type IV pilus assembly protein PilM
MFTSIPQLSLMYQCYITVLSALSCGIIFGMNLLSSLFGSKPDTFVGIDIGASYIKVAQLKKNSGRIILETYGEVALGPYEERAEGELTNLSDEQMVEALKTLLEHAHVTAKNAVISVSSATSLIFTLKLPNVGKNNLDTVVRNEARKYIPIPLTEITLDWWVIPKREVYGDDTQSNDDGKVDVLVAAVRNEIIEKYNNVVNGLNMFSSPAYEIETFSSIRGSLKRELAPVLLIDSGASGTRVAVVEHGVVRKFSVINRGSAYLSNSIAKSLEIEFPEAEKLKREVGLDRRAGNEEVYSIIEAGTNFIFSEIQNVILGYERDYNKPIRKILLTGGGSLLKNYKETIESRYNITTEYADPFDKAVSPDFLEEVLDRAGPEFTVALGLALQGLE